MEIEKDERKRRTIWRKYLRIIAEEGFIPDTRFAGVFCIREVSGYAVWYSRYLKEDTSGNVPDGDYLLRFFRPESKHLAIEFAVLAAKPALSSDDAIAALDAELENSIVLEAATEIKPHFEQIR
ncbi:hypothetical protein [Flavobacterium sp.]|uniref:hypothetical protein n=1 Tax=Flavobacterium sp. TaxID=239 RepID=UPI00262897B3|nr:hypothetical protein [Flavobacterium sp.]